MSFAWFLRENSAVMVYLTCFPRKFVALTLLTFWTKMAGLYLCRGLTRAKAAETLYAGTTFAVLAGNLRRKNPGEGEFFKSEFFQHLIRALNRADLLLSRADDREFQSSILNSTLRSSERCINAMDDLAPVDFRPEPSSVDLSNCPLKSPPKADESPLKCSTPSISSNSSTLSSPVSSSSSQNYEQNQTWEKWGKSLIL